MKPQFSIIIPTLNAAPVLPDCLTSIKKQKGIDFEIIIADGGSNDDTLNISKKFNCRVVHNPLRTAESGKSIGLKFARGEFISLIDSDNILPHETWLKEMLEPLTEDKSIIGSEPLRFTYRKKGGFIERYSSLIGANDPYAFVTGIYDRYSLITNKWTNLRIITTNKPKYLLLKLLPNQTLPTIGANGTVFRKSFLTKYHQGDYVFDIDLISQALNKSKSPLHFAKVKTGIIHTYCESSVSKFFRKQKRRLSDYYFFQKLRRYNWQKTNNLGTVKFTLYTLLFIPMLYDTFRGYILKRDTAWLFHPLACLITFYVYAQTTISFRLGLLKPLNRQHWSQ